MDKAVKPRRRRSIRHLRASTGFHSPPLPSAPYGSAWIDQDQETNMDNLVMSLSMLKCDQVKDDNEGVDDGLNQVDPSPSPHPAPDITEFETAGAYSEKRCCASEIDYGASELGALPYDYDSFSFSSDMPFCPSYLENHQEANTTSQSFPLNTYSNTSFENFNSSASCAVDYRQENDQARSDIEIDPKITERLHRDHTNDQRPFHDQDLEQMYRELSLDFSPIPEEDHSIDRLVEAIYSPNGVTDNKVKSSQNSNFDDSVMKVLSESQEASGIDLSLNGPLASESNTFNKTFDIVRFTPGDDSLRNHPRSISPESGIDDTSNSPNESTNRVSKTLIFNSENYFPRYVDTIESMDNSDVVGSCEFDRESDISNSFMPVVNEIETSDSTGENGSSVRIQHALSNVIKTSSASWAGNNYENLDSDVPTLGEGIEVGKQDKRSKRRSSRKFQLQEFSSALSHSDGKTSEYVSLASDRKGKNLQSVDILESEKENLVCYDKEAGSENLNHGVFFSGDNSGLSDCSNNQNVQRKKKTGRRSNSVTFLMKDCPPDLQEINGHLEDSSLPKDIPSKAVNVSYLDDISENESTLLDELSQERIQIESNSVESIDDMIEAEEENDPDTSVRKPKSKRNRKSWGNLSTHVTAPKGQGAKSGKKVSQSHGLQPSDLEQLYLQKKYTPVKPCNLETIKEIPAKGVLIGKNKFKRFINFPEDYRPSVAKVKSRTKKTMKHFRKCLDLKTIDEEEFRSRMQVIMIDLETLELGD